MSKKDIFIRCLLIVFVIVAFFIIKPNLAQLSVEDVIHFTPEVPLYAALTLLFIYAVKSFAFFIPLAVLYVSAGILFPPIPAILITYGCLWLEMTIGYSLGRTLGRNRIMTLIHKNKKADQILEFGNQNSFMSCMMIRVLPGPPSDVYNMIVGAMGISYPAFIAGSLIGISPNMIPMIFIADAISDPLSTRFITPVVIRVVFGAVALFVYFRKHRKQ